LSGFGLDNLPYGVFSRPGEGRRIGVRFEDAVLEIANGDSLNALMAAGPGAWKEARGRARALLEAGDAELTPLSEVELHLPFEVADYVDFYSSLDHATNLGRLFRPDAEPLLPNWRWLPIGYHGRAGTVVVSGTPIRRPSGQSKPPDATEPIFGPSRRLDIELELGFVIGTPSVLGEPVAVGDALEHVFGVVLVNDWSARDIQAWEYQPLGPFLGKSFATSIAAWVTPLEALEPFRVPGERQEPEPLGYLRTEPAAYDIALDVELNGAVVSSTSARHLYWSIEQQIAHATVNGASLRTGDLLATGTISGPEPDSRGSLIELFWNEKFLEDGDQVVLRGRAGDVELGEVSGVIT
jgi:fumarylacetoacetase